MAKYLGRDVEVLSKLPTSEDFLLINLQGETKKVKVSELIFTEDEKKKLIDDEVNQLNTQQVLKTIPENQKPVTSTHQKKHPQTLEVKH